MKRNDESSDFFPFKVKSRQRIKNTKLSLKIFVLRIQAAAVQCFPIHSVKLFKRMASFDPGGDKITMTKYPMRRVEMSVKKFVKVLSIDLDRLHKHTLNVQKFVNIEDWNGLHKEQVNASRTVQQIKANIRELEKTRSQVRDEDLSEFDDRVEAVKNKSVSSLQTFLEMLGAGPVQSHLEETEVDSTDIPSSSPTDDKKISFGKGDLTIPLPTNTGTSTSIPPLSLQVLPSQTNRLEVEHSIYANGQSCNHDFLDSLDSDPGVTSSTSCSSLPTPTAAPLSLQISDLHVVPQDSDALASWEILQENLLELNSVIQNFATEVERQGETINSIEEHIEDAHTDVQEGTKQLAFASKYKAAIFPVVGALVGGVVGGPVGLFAGLKLGGLAAGIGGAVGFAGGHFVKKRQDKVVSMEMKNLSDRRSVSMPEFLSREASDMDDDSSAPLNPK